jgi:lycopene cyclase CruA
MAQARTKNGDEDAPDLSHFRRRYPLTVANFGALPDREAWLRRIWETEARWRDALDAGNSREAIVRGAPPARLTPEGEFEIAYAGGAHALLHAAVMAHVHKRRVVVLEARAAGGRTERGWNVSNEELEGLARAGLFSKEEIEGAVVNRYRAGVVKFHDASSRVKAPPLEVRDVLDVAVDADKLLAAAATKLRAVEGCAIIDGARFVRAYVEPHRVSVEIKDARGARRLFAARLFIDAGGADSTVVRQLREGGAPTHVSPTVGSVARGFARSGGAGGVDFGVGEIMVSTEDASAHRQLLWGGFAGDARRDEFTSCLFFYDAADSRADKSLLALFEQYFEKLPAYKRAGAHWRVVRPVFGYGHSSRHRGWKSRGRGATDRVMLASGGAGRANPFALSDPGARLRDLRRSTHLTNLALAADLLDASALSEISESAPHAAHATHLAQFLRPPARATSEPATVNETLNAVMAALHDLDDRVRRELFQDRLSVGALRSLLSRTVRLYPRILQRIAAHLGARGTFLWLAHLTEAAFRERRDANDPTTDFDSRGEEAAREFTRHITLYRKETDADG